MIEVIDLDATARHGPDDGATRRERGCGVERRGGEANACAIAAAIAAAITAAITAFRAGTKALRVGDRCRRQAARGSGHRSEPASSPDVHVRASYLTV
jgi:hypothetical protein